MQTSGRIVRVPGLSGAWEVRESSRRRRRDSAVPRMRLRDWLLLIPDYDGQPHTLEYFGDAVRYVASKMKLKDQRLLLLALAGKLRSRAFEAFENGLHRHTSVEDFLARLRARFSGIGRETELFDQLHYLRQRADETVSEFGLRLDKLVAQLCAIYEDSHADEVEANKKLVRDIALASFRRGLRSIEMELRLRAFEPKTLDEAIGAAIAIENQLRSIEKPLKRLRESSYSTCKRNRSY